MRTRCFIFIACLQACGFPDYEVTGANNSLLCFNKPCKNGGQCVVADGERPLCLCSPGFSGQLCEINASCADGNASTDCGCSSGSFAGSCDQPIERTCREILAARPESPSGIYVVDPDGGSGEKSGFEVACDMVTDGGGWTLVGRELAGVDGTFAYLGIETGDSHLAALGTASALFGTRFTGLYREIRLSWTGPESGFIQFGIQQNLFDNRVDTAIPIDDFKTSSIPLQDWVTSDGGGIFCRASSFSEVRPGDTSWAVKPRADDATICGCSGYAWSGYGAYYGGHSDPTSCSAHRGAWAAVAADGEAKGNVTSFGLDIWVR